MAALPLSLSAVFLSKRVYYIPNRENITTEGPDAEIRICLYERKRYFPYLAGLFPVKPLLNVIPSAHMTDHKRQRGMVNSYEQ
jgi:hypothetical protein